MKFIHCADVHLDTPLQGLAAYEGAPITEIRNATRRAFEKVVDTAISAQVDFVLIAGDLYDVGLKSFESALFFNKQMAGLAEADIKVYLIYGNHDAASKLIKQLRPPKNVYVFRVAEAHTFINEKLGVAIHGQSFATPDVTEDLGAHYPAPVADFFNIGMLHTNLSGFSGHANYAPCSLQTLKNKGYQYWALGHVHNRQILSTDPYIVYPGNIQGRHGKEQGEKSCELVTVSEHGLVSVLPISTSVVPWIQVEIDASPCHCADEVYEKVRVSLGNLLLQSKERVTAVRLTIEGATDAHFELNRDTDEVRNEAISIANECGNGLLWIERVQVATQARADRESLVRRDDPIGEIVRVVAALRSDPTTMASLESITELQSRLPADRSEHGSTPIELDVAALMTSLDEAEALLLARLSGLEAQ
jgi:DNA repair exonuclease SbcCD nuclease subunit